MVKIIYDSEIEGHHTEYITHLIRYITNDENDEERYIFLVPEEMQYKFPEIIKLADNCDNIKWEFISNLQCTFLKALPLYKRSFKELALVNSYADKFEAKEVFLLYFNIFQLALIFKRPLFDIKGILFLQFYRMQKNTIFQRLKYYRKYWITKLYCYNSKIKTVFVLNDDKTVDFLNNRFKTRKFKMLSDPIPIYQEEKTYDVFKHYNIPRNKKILLHPGAIDPRKGTYEIIEAVDLLKDKETDEFAILIVGKAKADIENVIKEKLSTLKNNEFTIIFDNTFVSNECLKSLLVQCYAVLMPYKNVEASSGILGHAAINNKRVLAPDSGLIGEIIKKYKLGILIDKPTALCIASGIKNLHKFDNNEASAAEFVSGHTADIFSDSMLNFK